MSALVGLTLRIVAAAPPDRAVQAAAVRLLGPGERVDELASSLGFSERQLRRRFLDAVGYGPKTLQRVLRLRRFLAQAVGSSDGLARAAIDAGYADQAHLSRECRALTGLTPVELVTR
jgi:transcriptional regulator GlxA family with amidase domain